jgi:hypothetical protein
MTVGIFAVQPAAAAVPVTAGPGSSVGCVLKGAGTVSPPLKNNWLKAEHSGANADPNPNAIVKDGMASIPTTIYAANGGANTVVTTTYILSGLCAGSVTDGTRTTAVKAMTIHATQVTDGLEPATCHAIVAHSTLTERINWIARPDTKMIAPTTATTSVVFQDDGHGHGFEWDSTSVTGSFASGHINTTAYVDNATTAAISSVPPTFDHPVRDSNCEPSLHAKFTPASPGTAAAFHAYLGPPPGFTLIHIGLADGDSAGSNLLATR